MIEFIMMGSELHEVYNYVLDMLGLYALDILVCVCVVKSCERVRESYFPHVLESFFYLYRLQRTRIRLIWYCAKMAKGKKHQVVIFFALQQDEPSITEAHLREQLLALKFSSRNIC